MGFITVATKWWFSNSIIPSAFVIWIFTLKRTFPSLTSKKTYKSMELWIFYFMHWVVTLYCHFIFLLRLPQVQAVGVPFNLFLCSFDTSWSFSEHILVLWLREMLQAHLAVCPLQPKSCPFLQGSLVPFSSRGLYQAFLQLREKETECVQGSSFFFLKC